MWVRRVGLGSCARLGWDLLPHPTGVRQAQHEDAISEYLGRSEQEWVSSMMFWNGGGWGGGAWLAMSLMMIVFSGGLVALTVWLVRGFRTDADKAPTQAKTRNADEVLAERFAGGEIDQDEFQRRRGVLQSNRTRA